MKTKPLRQLLNFSSVREKLRQNPRLDRHAADAQTFVEEATEHGVPPGMNKKLHDSVRLTKEAAEATRRAEALSLEGVRVQSVWDGLCERYEQLTAAIGRAEECRSSLEFFGANLDLLIPTFSFDGEMPKQTHLAVEIAKARIALPIVQEAKTKLQEQLRSHVAEMVSLAKQHGLPFECIKGVVDA